MKALLFIFFLLIQFTTGLFAQDISFSDFSLKSYLINENCVDTNGDGIYDSTADLNTDNQVQYSEAESIIDLKVGQYPDSYFIHSMQDLSAFSNLERLSLIHHDSLTSISDLNLEKLNFIWIGTSRLLKHIDLSDLPNLYDLRIEDIDSLSYLNIQNGSFPGGIFSLFYTEDIQYACIDSIEAEFEAVKWQMGMGLIPSVDCGTTSTTEEIFSSNLQISPNPSQGFVQLQHTTIIHQVKVYDMNGTLRLKTNQVGQELNLSSLENGMYFIVADTEAGMKTGKVILDF